MLIQILLVLLGPSHSLVPMVPKKSVTAEFADDERLVLSDLPGQAVGFLRQPVIPTDVFVAAQHIEVFSQWIINHLRVGVRVVTLVGSSEQTRRIQLPRVINQALKELKTR